MRIDIVRFKSIIFLFVFHLSHLFFELFFPLFLPSDYFYSSILSHSFACFLYQIDYPLCQKLQICFSLVTRWWNPALKPYLSIYFYESLLEQNDSSWISQEANSELKFSIQNCSLSSVFRINTYGRELKETWKDKDVIMSYELNGTRWYASHINQILDEGHSHKNFDFAKSSFL